MFPCSICPKGSDDIQSLNPEELVRADALGRELNFAPGVPYFRRNLKLFGDLSEISLDSLPFQRLTNLTQLANGAASQFKQIQDFSLETAPQSPKQTRDNLITAIDNYDALFDGISPVIAYGIRKGTDFAKLESEAKSIVEQMRSDAVQSEASHQQVLKEMGDTLEKVQRAAAEVGVAQHAIHFREEAKEHEHAAKYWLVTTTFIGMLTVGLGIAGLFYFVNLLP